MTTIQDGITPCPFSKNYRLPRDQAWRSLRIYLFYRTVFASVLITLCFSGLAPTVYSKLNPHLFGVVSSIYFGLVVISSFLLFAEKPDYSRQAQSQILLDIVALTLLMHTGGGIETGLGILLVVTVAAGGILVGGRCALSFAAVASLSILGDQFYSDLMGSRFQVAYSYAGYLGMSFFTVALLAHTLARRAELSQAIAEKRGIDLANLQQLNEYILQHLQSGIVIVDADQKVRMMNEPALRLFKIPLHNEQLHNMPPPLLQEYKTWLATPLKDYATLQVNDDEVEARFTQLGEKQQPFYMISLEESHLINQRVQEKKLASLGRLTAAIAHEIRNPLGALSHAAQLLAESPAIDRNDLRLTEIIQQHSQRINVIIEDILHLSKRKQSARQPIDLGCWAEKFMADFQSEQQLPNSPLQLDIPAVPVTVCIDPGQLKQIVDNLCLNALKHANRENLVIQMRIRNEPVNRAVVLDVIDNGAGVSPGKAQHIFEPFFTTSATGTGLGLYVVRELAELNQARIEYIQGFEEGSCFRLILSHAESEVVEQ